MATSLLMRMRPALFAKNLLERKFGAAVCTGILDKFANCPTETSSCVSKSPMQHEIRQMSSGQRDIHHTRTSILFDADSKHDYEESDLESNSDSDSDNEASTKNTQSRAQSHFWRRKMRTLHSHLDVNKDGVLSYDDFMLLGERFAKMGHLTARQKEEFQLVLRQMWVEQWGEISPYNLVDVEKYLAEMHHVLEDKSLRRKVHHFLPYLFQAVDKDKSGEISVQEFKLFFKCLGLGNDDAVVSFTYIDINEDGKISLEEFVKLGRDFILTQNHHKPSKHFWGPLID